MVNRSANTCLLAVYLLMSGVLCAQEYSFRTLGTAEGLDNLAVRRIYQDRAGFIWVSTENGIYRYDGERIEAFGRPQGIPANGAAAFGDAPDGSLLVGGDFGLYHLVVNHFEKLTVPFTTVSWAQGIQSDDAGHTYIGTESGLMELTQESSHGGFAVRKLPAPPGVTGTEASAVFVHGTTVWYGCGQQLCRLDPKGVRVYGREQGLPGVPLLEVQKDRDGNLWTRARDAGIFVRPAGEADFRRRAPSNVGTIPSSFLAVDADKRILLGFPDGLLIDDASGWQKIDRHAGLHGTVYSAFEDRQHALWIGTEGRGLIQWRGYREWQSYSAESGLASDTVYGILPRADGSLWVGTEAGLMLGRPQGFGFSWKKVPGLGSRAVHGLVMDASGDLWAATETKGLARIRARTSTVEWFGQRQGLSGREPHGLRLDRHQNLWVATEEGLFVAKTPYSKFSRIAELPATRIWTVVEASDGAIWAGGAGGLFSNESGKWRNWTQANGLSNKEVLSLGAGTNGTLWVGYRFGGGIDRVHVRSGTLAVEKGVQRRGSDGLIYFLDFDSLGRLWAGTEQGVDMWDGSRWSHYDMTDGLVWNDCDLGSFAEGSDGALWIGTSGGLSRFKPRPHPSPESPPNVVFTGIQMGPNDISGMRNPSFDLNSGALIVRFSALNAPRQNGVVFRYRLEGANPAWTRTTERALQFAELPPGAYRLQIEAQDSEGAWNPRGAEFPFEILTPWYGRRWFIGTCILVAFLLIAGTFRLRFQSAKRRERELEQIVESKTSDLRRVNETLQRLSTLDSLTGLANRRVFDQSLEQECARMRRSGTPLSLIIFDVDHFKALNDSEGHQRGDEYLALIGKVLTGMARRQIDVAARYGGEEFALILPATEVAGAVDIAESARMAIAALRLPNPTSTVEAFLTVSAGIANALPDLRSSPEELLAAADRALYRAKRAGRNRVEVCHETSRIHLAQ